MRTFELMFICEPCNQRATILKVYFSDDGTLKMVGICCACGTPIDFHNNVVQWMYAELNSVNGGKDV